MYQQAFTLEVPGDSSTASGHKFAPVLVFGYIDLLNGIKSLNGTGAQRDLVFLPVQTYYYIPPENPFFSNKITDSVFTFYDPVTTGTPSVAIAGQPYSWQAFNVDTFKRPKTIFKIDVTYISRNLSTYVPPTDISFAPTVAMLGNVLFTRTINGQTSSNSYNLQSLWNPGLFVNPNAKENFTISFDCNEYVDEASSLYLEVDTWIRAYPTVVITLHYK